jgi:acyl-CoA synthetase (AMP-forming)/AMP-acid ligase II
MSAMTSRPQTMPAMLEESARRYGDHPAIVDGERRTSYAALAKQVHTAGRAFLAIGVQPGDRVGLWAPNRTEFVIALLGAECIGAAVVPLNTRYRGHEARVILERSRATALVLVNGFLGADYGQLLRDSAPEGAAGDVPVPGLPHLRTVVDLDAATSRDDTLAWSEFLARAGEVDEERARRAVEVVSPETVCDIMFTSGTTGVPKGVMSVHRQSLGVAEVWAEGASLGPEDRYAIVNPFFHGFGYKAGVLAALLSGTTIFPVSTFDPERLMTLIEREGITVLPGAPTIFLTLLQHPRRPEFDLSSLRFSIAGAASVPESLFQRMRDELGFSTVAQAYGLTECVVATQSRPDEDPAHVAQTTGPAVRGLEIRIADPDGNEVPAGIDGEVQIRGDNVMLGYFEDEAATRQAIDEQDWLHTGDIGRLDEHGCVKITDRMKDLFITGGFNVYPAEVESVLSDHSDVVEAAVVGIPDARMGAVGRAFVVLHEGSELDEESLRSWCRERLANFKVPREYVARTAFPRTASGKVLKTELRDDA